MRADRTNQINRIAEAFGFTCESSIWYSTSFSGSYKPYYVSRYHNRFIVNAVDNKGNNIIPENVLTAVIGVSESINTV